MGSIISDHPLLSLALAVLSTVAAVARAWIRHRTVVDVERERTRRVLGSVAGARRDRAEVVRACADLEGSAAPRRIERVR
ncbi:hypothetical protein [Kitasatospora sp. NPDC004289]